MVSVAIPTGVLTAGALELLSRSGLVDLNAEELGRRLLVERSDLRVILVRPADVPAYVDHGAADLGIVGKDILWESSRVVYELLDLRFGGCRLVLAAPEGSPLALGEWPPALRVATKYPRAARHFFDNIKVTAELIKLHGSVELAPHTGLADAVLDITATGETLRANRLVEVAEAAHSTARLVVNQASLKTRSDAVDAVAAALRRAVSSAPVISG